jgi:hypothetical protein
MPRRSASPAASRRREYADAAVLPLAQAVDDLPVGRRSDREAWLRSRGLVIPAPWSDAGEVVVWGDVLAALRSSSTAPKPKPAPTPRKKLRRADW